MDKGTLKLLISPQKRRIYNRFTIPRDVYFGEGSLEVLKTLEGKKATVVIGGQSIKSPVFSIKSKLIYERQALRRN
ncbi:hypothetical protein [Peribacillus butanolivorans]|uniref:hypothetical protein n=1 Tax=Peribacillus butanolivorans TaxID=421767 RepID=UPI0020D1FDB1|nr:hypothetical protein [Peribacillus butanolivorans]